MTEEINDEKQYYIVSLKHTSKGDAALTFWRHNSLGYTWRKDNAGIYSKEDVSSCVNEDNVAVEKEKVDKFWMDARDFNNEYISVPNNPTVLRQLGLSSKFMKPKKYASCRMVFLNTPISINK